MIRTFAVSLFAWIALHQSPLFAQTKEVVEELDTMLAQQRIAIRQTEERNEDIEVFRRMLNKTFGFADQTSQLADAAMQLPGSTSSLRPGSPIIQNPFSDPNSPGQFHANLFTNRPLGKQMSQAVGPFDGVYLKGAGVVYTVRVPKVELFQGLNSICVGDVHKELGLASSCNQCHSDVKEVHRASSKVDCYLCHRTNPVALSQKPLSEWDRIRADVRGEKPAEVTPSPAAPSKPKAALCKPGDLRELVIVQLHTHAKQIRHLAKTEQITVAFTFDEVPGTKPSSSARPAEKPSLSAEELKFITLGDLHLKQGKFSEATEAYEKALIRFRGGPICLAVRPNLPHEEVMAAVAEMEKQLRSAYKSLATARLQSGDLDDAKAALDKALSLKVEMATQNAEKPSPRLPGKLVVSVSRGNLETLVKLQDFRKAVAVETSGFPVEAGK